MEELQDPKKLFGLEIRKRLLEIDMTQKELAHLVGTSEAYIWHITHGRRRGNKYIDKIMSVLEMDKSKR